MIPLKQTVIPFASVNMLYKKPFPAIIFIYIMFCLALGSKAFANSPIAGLNSGLNLTSSIASDQEDNQNVVFPSTPTLVLQNRNNKTVSLDNYMEKRQTKIAPETPTLRESLNNNSELWQPLLNTSRAARSKEISHWYRFRINNLSGQTQQVMISVTPGRVLSLRSAIINNNIAAQDSKTFIENTPPLQSIYNRRTSITHYVDMPLTLAKQEHVTVLLELVTDNWVIPNFSLNNSENLNTLRERENNYWKLVTGIFIGMIFFIVSATIITKQSGLPWLLCYSIASICLVPGFLISNLNCFNLTSEHLDKLSISMGSMAIIAFIGVLKYIFYNFAFLQRIRNYQLIFVMVVLSTLCAVLPFYLADWIVRLSAVIEVFITLILSIIAYRQGHPAIATAIGPIKFTLFFLIGFAIFQATQGTLTENHIELWLASSVMLEAALLNIIMLILHHAREQAQLYTSINAAKKAQQIATISPLLGSTRHDLRASLSDIIGLSELIIESPLDQAQRKHILDLQRSGRKALGQINQIFSFQSQDKPIQKSQEPFKLSTLLSESTQYYGYRADELKKEIIAELSSDSPDYWTGDHEQIRQLLMHILEHFLATKQYNEIRIEPGNFSDNSLDIVFNLKADQIDTDESQNKTHEISGARTILKRLGGELSLAASNNGLSICAHIPATVNNHREQKFHDMDLLRNRRIIIIDDSETSCNVIESYLIRWDIVTFKANNFNNALAIIRHQASIEQPIDLALVDYVMPDVDGIEVSQRLRADPEVPSNLALIIMSNAASFIDMVSVKNYGVKRVLDKPVLGHTLQLVLLEEFYFLRSLADGIAQQHSQNDQAEYQVDDHDHQSADSLSPEVKTQKPIKLLMVEDNPVSAKIVGVMLNKLELEYQHVQTGEAALNSVRAEDFDIILMDCELPDESGFDTTRKIRALEKNRKQQDPLNMNKKPISIIALTAYDDVESRKQCLASGMDEYLSKPINLMQLDAVICRSLRS